MFTFRPPFIVIRESEGVSETSDPDQTPQVRQVWDPVEGRLIPMAIVDGRLVRIP